MELSMKLKHVFVLVVFIMHIIFVLYLAIILGFCANSKATSPALPLSVALHQSITQEDTINQNGKDKTFGKVADYFDSGENLLDWDSFNTNKTEGMVGIPSVHIKCEADHNLNFFTVDDKNGKRFDKLITQMAADVINNNFSMASDTWRNASLVMEMSLLVPVTSEKYSICVSHCNQIDEECKFADLDYTIEDISNRMSKMMSLTLNASNKMVECSGFSDYFREQHAQIDILTWEGQMVRSHNVLRYLEKGSVRIYGLFDLDDILKAKGVRCTLQFRQYRKFEINWYIIACLAVIPFVLLCLTFCCFLRQTHHIFSLNHNSYEHGKIASGNVEESKINGDGYKSPQKCGEANTNLKPLEIHNSKCGYLDPESIITLKQSPPFSEVNGNKVHVKIYKVESNKKHTIPLGTGTPSVEHEKGAMSGLEKN